MKPEERENLRYLAHAENPIDIEEQVMFSLLPKSDGGMLLDVGCGIGTISLELQKRGFKVNGLDFSSVAVKKAKEKGINAIECDVDKEGIPFGDNYFDVVWAGDVVEHVFDPIFLLSEMARVVKPTGKVLLTVPNAMNLINRTYTFITGRSPQSGAYRRLGQCKHHTLFSLELLEYMLNKAGLPRYHLRFITRFPILSRQRHTKSKILGALFGTKFIVEAGKG